MATKPHWNVLAVPPFSALALLLLYGCAGSDRTAETGDTSATGRSRQERAIAARSRPRESVAGVDGNENRVTPSARPADSPDRRVDVGYNSGPLDDGSPREFPRFRRFASRRIDESRVAAAGIRKLTGKHIALYTDLPPGTEVDELPGVFDQAFPQWCDYFAVDAGSDEVWRVNCFLIKDREPFTNAELLPDDLPPFTTGFQRRDTIWIYEQPTAYLRRHLLLHEGTHAFMRNWCGGDGSPWYFEGTAELLGTHRWQAGKLTLGHFPRNRQQVPQWGRINTMKSETAAGRAMTMREIVNLPAWPDTHDVGYAWAWGAAAFLEGHPRYRRHVRRMSEHIGRRDFSKRLTDALEDQWPRLSEQWQLFVFNLEYGYDVERAAVKYETAELAGTIATVAADRGWQSSGIRLQAGMSYRIAASGRYQVAREPKIWWCEPGGVTIRYYQGRPLGVLLGAFSRDDVPQAPITPLASPMVIGLGHTISPERSGTLYLRINESAAELGDNAGTLTVEITLE